jgi:hypothetical protein
MMVVSGRVDNLGKISIGFGNSMSLRVNYSDAQEIMNLIGECTHLIKEQGLENKCDFPVCDAERELREQRHRARRSAMEVPSMGSPAVNVKEASESQRVDPFDSVKEIANDPVEW